MIVDEGRAHWSCDTAGQLRGIRYRLCVPKIKFCGIGDEGHQEFGVT
jgi:hypothetical protein